MERLRHLVVILPGILGSVLEDQRGHQVWGVGLRGTVGTAGVRPWRLSVAENPRLVPVGLLPSISVVPPVFRVPGYDQLVRMIQNRFADVVVDTAHPERAPVGDANVLLVPYDFRVGIEAAAEQVAAEVNKRLEGLLPSARRRRVIVVAHSFGGLVARYWLGPGGGAADCAALITMGTPHGAPRRRWTIWSMGCASDRNVSGGSPSWRAAGGRPTTCCPATRPSNSPTAAMPIRTSWTG